MIPLACCVSYYIVKSNWTNFLACEMYRESLLYKIMDLKDDVNEQSSSVLDYVHSCIDKALFWNFPSAKIALPEHQYKYQKEWFENLESTKRKYNLLGIKGIFPEVLYFHHGLRFANKKILDYVKTRDIMDCGAYVGDSLLVLRKYTDETVYCFEFSQKTISTFRKVMSINNISSGYELIESAIGEHPCSMSVGDSGKHNNSLYHCPGGNVVNVTTIDEEVKKHKMKVGFIKADLEGHGFKMVKGAIATIKSHRPVLSIGIYHNYEELFEIKPFIQKEVENYEFEFQLHRFSEGKFVELTLFCYPKELKVS